MAKVLNISDTESFSDEEDEKKNVQMADRLGFEMTSRIPYSTNIGGSNICGVHEAEQSGGNDLARMGINVPVLVADRTTLASSITHLYHHGFLEEYRLMLQAPQEPI